ncbi:MAG: hypothetical protein KatS3mg064_0288 [Tepidiforma sp.]|nr:signal peptidase I [Tepidiforma sp.]GIW17131.1 MAG: hypothetical protein KatS3mg064_0288 [Tepidiforma sp.]
MSGTAPGHTARAARQAGPRAAAAFAAAGALLFLLAAAGWVLFAPQQLGGQTAYVIVNGNSMEPGMQRGDLAIVRRADDYRPGDVVTYRHPEVGHVIHRIIDVEDGRYTLQGDNNDFTDSYHPGRGEVVGRLWFRVPGAGRVLWHLRSPLWTGIVLSVAFAGLLGSSARPRPGSAAAARRNHHRGGGHPMAPIYRNWQDALALLLAVGLGFAALAWVGFGRGLEKTVPAEREYTQRGEFVYDAAAADGSIYDAGRATTGEPVYLRLSDRVTFGFSYEFLASRPASVSGSYHLVAELGDASGWKRTIPVGEPGTFEGTAFQAKGTLDLAAVREQIAALEAQSGVVNDRYSVTIKPQVRISGELDGLPFESRFDAAALPLALDRSRLWLNSAEPAALLRPSETSVVTAQRTVGNHVQIWFVSVPVVAARIAGSAGALIAFGSAGALIAAAARRGWGERAGGTSPAAPVRIAGSGRFESADVIDVASMADLERIAERTGGIILQEARPGSHVCYVRDGAAVYRFVLEQAEYGTERAA